jgi:hypothetical protein
MFDKTFVGIAQVMSVILTHAGQVWLLLFVFWGRAGSGRLVFVKTSCMQHGDQMADRLEGDIHGGL